MAHQGEVLKNPVTGQSLVFRRTTAETAGARDGHVNERGMPGLPLGRALGRPTPYPTTR